MKDFSLIELLKGFGRKRVNEDPYPEAAEHPVLHGLDVLVLADTHHAIPADQLYQKTQTDPDLVLILGDVNFADLQTFFNAVYQLADLFRRDRSFCTGDPNPVSQLFRVENLSFAVGLYNHRCAQERTFIGVEAFFTGRTVTSALKLTIFRFSRKNHICFWISAKRTVHNTSYLVISAIKNPHRGG